jgi:hypothetical protein
MATQAQLVSYVLWRLRARASGQQPLTEDSADVTVVLPFKLADLAQRGVFYVADDEDIPDAAVEWIGRLVEQSVASAYGVPEDAGAIRYAEGMLRNQELVPRTKPLEDQTIEHTSGGCPPCGDYD